MRILVIDDNELMCRTLRRVFAPHDAVVETSAQRALERASREEFDLVLCDLHRPEMSGRELFERLPANEATLHLLMSGDGGYGMLTKPFTMQELWAAVDALKAARCA